VGYAKAEIHGEREAARPSLLAPARGVDLVTTLLAIDPGSDHCGVAVFVDGAVVYTAEKKPRELFDWLDVGRALFGGVGMEWDVVVCESFRLAATAAKAQIGSAFGTVEVIGVVREYCRARGIEFVEQPPAIKRPTAAILRAHGEIQPGKGPHVKDAWVHGRRWLMREGDE